LKTKYKETKNERNPTNSLNIVFKSIANIEYFDGSLVAGHNSQGKKEQEQAANPMPTRSSQVQPTPPHPPRRRRRRVANGNFSKRRRGSTARNFNRPHRRGLLLTDPEGRLDSRPSPATPGMPSSRLVHLILLATLSLLLAQTLASSAPVPAAGSASAESGDPCAATVADGEADVPLCPVRCFRPDPVCGADGVTYWCGCPEATCAGARVARRGYCEVGSGMGGCRSPASRTRAAWGSRGGGCGRQLLRRGLRHAAVRCGRPLLDGSGIVYKWLLIVVEIITVDKKYIFYI
jgi:hypothetical protein